jgi:hypothetical protein
VLEPQLRHNREEFERVGRLQRLVLLGAPVAGAVLLVSLAVLSAPRWTNYLLFVLAFAIVVAEGILELRRVHVYRRDLRERRGGPGEQNMAG